MAAISVSGCLQPCRWSCCSTSLPAITTREQIRGLSSPNSPLDAGEHKTSLSQCILRRRLIIERTVSSFVGHMLLGGNALAIVEDDSRLVDEKMETLQRELKKVLKKSKAAGMLRLAFHDAGTFDVHKQTGGMNGSIIYELGRPENKGLDRTVKLLETVKESLSKSVQVSWADLIAVAGAEAVALCGGPQISIKLGRLDSFSGDPEGELPAETMDASSLKKVFSRKGLTTQEMVVLSGAHTLGRKGFGDPAMFDNSYFKVLLEKPWAQNDEMSKMIGLPSDWILVEDDECLRWVLEYASHQSKFFHDFSMAYTKLVNAGVVWRGDQVFLFT